MRDALARGATGLLARRQRRLHGPRAVVLTYHRIAEPGDDPLGLCVGPARFAEHLEVVRACAVPRPLEDLPHALDSGGASDNVCITFDDGYADTLHTAAPLLERYSVPATVFVVSGQHDAQREFWWDEIGRVLFDTVRLPAGPMPAGLTGRAVHDAAMTDRAILYGAVHTHLSAMEAAERDAALDTLRRWAGALAAVRPTHAPLTPDQLRQLADHPLIEIGAHTVTHPALDRLDVSAQRAEIEESKRWLEHTLGRPVTSFAYPHGRYTIDTARLARDAGFARACTVTPRTVAADTDPWQLPRVLVRNIDGPALAAWLRRLYSQAPSLPNRA